MDLTTQFLALSQQAFERDLLTASCRDVEPLMIALVRLVQQHPEHRGVFVELFLGIDVGTYPAPHYLLAFCMRELKFPEIREKLRNEASDTPQFRRRMNHISRVMHAFDDEVWEEAALWASYENEGKRGSQS